MAAGARVFAATGTSQASLAVVRFVDHGEVTELVNSWLHCYDRPVSRPGCRFQRNQPKPTTCSASKVTKAM